MKRKLLIGLVALTSGVAVIGSGYASWYFSASDINSSTNVGTYVTSEVGLGTFTNNDKDTKITLVLDQSGPAFYNIDSTTITKDGDLSADKKISAFTSTYLLELDNIQKLSYAGVGEATLTVTMSLTDAAQTYLQFGSEYTVSNFTKDNSTTGTLKFTKTFTFNSDTTAINDSYSFPTTGLLEYSNGKPNDSEKLTAMTTALKGKEAFKLSYEIKASQVNA